MTPPILRRASGGPPAPRHAWPVAVPHGGPDYAELAGLGLQAESLIDFSVNCNPLGASPRAMRALSSVDPSRYPDRQALRLRAGLAAAHDVSPDDVLAGNGSTELIWLLASVYLDPGDVAVVVGPTFGEYEAAIRRRRAEPVIVRASAADGFRPRLEELVGVIQETRPRLVFVCNPNNPTGQALTSDELAVLLAACDETLLIVDEAYRDFADGLASALELRSDPRVVVLRSLTKSFGLGGLRLGYTIAQPSVIEAVQRAQPPWSVNAAAQTAGLAALGDTAHVAAGRQLARRAKAYLVDGLGRLGLRCLPSCTSFWLVEVGDAAELRRQLLVRGILVRDCSSFGLPKHIRLAARPLAQCEKLLSVLEYLYRDREGAGARI
ncbi:MAG TPA: histidinol-phosphate transaminase [Chloroflexota bacterium]|nr:histidinol-phosphate transaminase [Chloroflexota bacterium]